jgi:hypothetical protein
MYCTNPKLPSQMVRIQRRTVRIQQRTVQPRGRTVRAYRRTIRVSNRMVRCIVFKEDCYLNPHPSQQNFPSYPTAPQHHNTPFQTHGGEHCPAHRRPERDDWSYEPHRADINTPQNSNQWGEDNMPVSKQPHQYWTKESTVSHRMLLI